ncbi:MAG: DEAD/DEAH box helicase, partial [Mycobacterium leprae]
EPPRRGVKAIVVYPMNALANSQLGELEKFLRFGYGEGREPVTFARYTGQESRDERERILKSPPDVLLTNYVMLELVLTRPDERQRLVRAARGLRFLVLDELHTYRGRQGADVALLVRRVRDACEAPDLQCVGTSATMASGGTFADQQRVVAEVATRLFGALVTPERVIGETLRRATREQDPSPDELRVCVRRTRDRWTYGELADDPLAGWIETTFGLAAEPSTGRLVRQVPTRLSDAAADLAELTGDPEPECADAIRATLLAGSRVRDPETGRTLFAFRLHQFLSKGDTVHVSLEPEATRHVTSQYQVVVPGEPGKALLPLAFCCECGQEYYVVAATTRDGRRVFVPRRDRDASGGADANGYLFVCAEEPWPPDPLAAERLPDSWVVTDEAGYAEVAASRRRYLPRPVWVAPDGSEAEPGAGLAAAWVPSPFLFCLRCRVSYEADPRAGLREAGHARRRGPQLGRVGRQREHRPQPAAGAGGAARPAGAQAAHLRGQPAGREPAGRALQRLRAGRAVARCVVSRSRRGAVGADPRGRGGAGHRGAGAGVRVVRREPRREVLAA